MAVIDLRTVSSPIPQGQTSSASTTVRPSPPQSARNSDADVTSCDIANNSEAERDSASEHESLLSEPPSPDPLHDEAADSEDEAWVNRNLRYGIINEHADETVQCPCCFAVLSVRCQSHERYEGQFRALFVLNCETVDSQRLKVYGEQFSEEHFTPVACSTCHTEVAVLDSTGIYHFCNVMY
ncbi:E2F-associated phosphoprotein [Gracilariopsis chorda]|uniref:E2F-associated phosphoprotein n=1 Tax=Gracilariopsis chorda TaxID=448386 RepID=A0A2V3J071_9FLOR|nr:E2F-associated phosphoprotein [Gracilariopsis chorda]|eukprot:PXF47327.1 E2F-associated phosphoprotein [Gracilariopsis chorda]